MKSAQTVVLRPVFTEKSTARAQALNVLTFEVARGANKIEIRQAVERLFSVKVAAVRTVKVASKIRKVGKSIGRTSEAKKAYVKLKAGEKLPAVFEGV